MAEFGNSRLRLNDISNLQFANLRIRQSRFASWQFAVREFSKSRERFSALGCGVLEGKRHATIWESGNDGERGWWGLSG